MLSALLRGRRRGALMGAARRGLSLHARAASKSWEQSWQAAVDKVVGNVGSYEQSAKQLREMTQAKLIKFTDLRDDPERFFLAHRTLARRAPQLGPGFWIRMTVSFNLCGGTVLAVGSDEQIKQLDAMQAAGQLGCFALTEKFAGVNSGLVVQTKATYDAPTGEFVLQTPTPGAQKNWISQGLVADKAVVVADLVVGGKSVGPHAFLMDLRKNGQLVKGVSLTDMGKKTVGNDLDNASINFEGVRMPRSSLLSRFAEVTAEGQYVSKSKVPTMVMIGQRLFSGRVAVAQAALEYRRGLFEMTRAYSDRKKCWSPAGTPTLSSLPHIAALYQECEPRAERLEAFARKCEEQLNVCLRKDAIPPVPLMDAIAVAKFSAVDESIDMCFRLKKEVGSYALMAGAGFDQMDFLSCCAFAEGDSRILKMKLARDRVRDFQKAGTVGSPQEDELCRAISSGMADHLAASPADKQGAMDAQWRLMYQLADASAHRIIDQTLAA